MRGECAGHIRWLGINIVCSKVVEADCFKLILLVRILIADDECGVAQTVCLQSLHVDVGYDQLFFERESFRCGELASIFGYDGSPREYEVGAAFSES